MSEIKTGPSSSAPAFALLLPVTFAIFADSRGVSLAVSLLLSLLVIASWLLLATPGYIRSWASAALFMAVLTLLLSFICLWRIEKTEPLPSSIDTEGKVVMKREWGRLNAILIKTGQGLFAAYLSPAEAPPEGSRVYVRGAVFPFKRADAKSRGFDEYLFWKGKSASAKLVILEIKELTPPSGIYLWKSALRSRIKETLPKHVAGYMLALTLGDRDKELTKLHRNAGTVHLLSVSGFHVGVLVFILSFFFKKGIKKFLSISIIMWLYLLFSGLPPGGIRAGLMVQIYLAGLVIGRPVTPFNSVSAAALLMLLWSPWYFFDVGWQLSVSAALFISSFLSINKKSKSASAAASVLVWFVTAPLVSSVFKEVPAAGILINIIAVPLFSFIFPCVILASVPAMLYLPGGNVAAEAAEYFLKAWAAFSDFMTSLVPWASVNTYSMTVTALLIFFASSLAASSVPVRRIAPLAALFTLLLLFFA